MGLRGVYAAMNGGRQKEFIRTFVSLMPEHRAAPDTDSDRAALLVLPEIMAACGNTRAPFVEALCLLVMLGREAMSSARCAESPQSTPARSA
jgi:hypothetical protein